MPPETCKGRVFGAPEAGDPALRNTVMGGALTGSGYPPLAPETVAAVIERTVSAKAPEPNRHAFQPGSEAAKRRGF